MSNMIFRTVCGERVQIQFTHGRDYFPNILGKHTKWENAPYTTVYVVHRDKNHAKDGEMFNDGDGPWIEQVIKYKGDKENRKEAREFAVEKLAKTLRDPENAKRLRQAFENRGLTNGE